MILITRYDADGKIFHQRKDHGPAELIYSGDYVNDHVIALSTPLRFWAMLPGGRIEIEAL